MYLGRVQNRDYKVLLDSCSRFNVLNFPRSQKWNKYQKGSGSRVLVFLQDFWNPSYSGVLVRSQKTHNFLWRKWLIHNYPRHFQKLKQFLSRLHVLYQCVLVGHNLRLNVPYFTSPSPILDAPYSVIPLPESQVSIKRVTTSPSPCPVECFHSRGQHLCKFTGTKEGVCIRKEFNSHRTGLGHQHGRRFIVLRHQYGRRDVMWKHSI